MSHHGFEHATGNHLALLNAIGVRKVGGRTEMTAAQTSPSVVLVPWLHFADATPVAFIGCFAGAGQNYVFPLKNGLNRVGRGAQWGDHAEIPATDRIMESRQWIILCRPPLTIVADDHTTNGSIVVPRDVSIEKPVTDPRYATGQWSYPAILQSGGSGLIRLDWEGSVTADLHDGDALLTMYGGFVYGLLPTTVA